MSTIPQTKEKKYVYRTGDYELEFIVGHDPDMSQHELTVLHINLIKADSNKKHPERLLRMLFFYYDATSNCGFLFNFRLRTGPAT